MAPRPLDPAQEPVGPGELALDVARAAPLSRQVLARRLTYIMLVRVILFTLILGGTITVNLAWGTPEELGGPYVTLFFVLIAGMYVLNILYAVALRLVQRLPALAVTQIVGDLALSGVLVHFTGGADSAFVLFFLLAPIGAAVTLGRRAALIAAASGAVTFALVALLGQAGVLPALPGQVQLPWATRPGQLGRSLLTNNAAMFAVAVLSGYLAEQLRSAAAKVEVQQARLDDLAVLYTDIIRCLTSGLVTINTEGVVLSLNRAAAEILGLTHVSQVAGKRLADLAPQLATAVASGAETRRVEVALSRERQQRPLLLGISISPLTDHMGDQRGSIINFQDLTPFRELEETIQRSAHFASLGRMAAGIAHEIRNPLASISGSLELLRAAQHGSVEDRKLMAIALHEIERLNTLITDFLAYARPRLPQLEPLDLGREIDELTGAISGLMSGENTPTVKVVESASGLWVRADRDQLAGVLWNLVRNAWEAGEVHQIDVAVGRHDERRMCLVVSDRAAGIPEEQRARIFEPFFTTKERGTGLGLATVQRIVQEHGGTVDVHSTIGRGTTFTILLPLVPPPTS